MNTCDEDIEADDKIIAEEGERELYEHFRFLSLIHISEPTRPY